MVTDELLHRDLTQVCPPRPLGLALEAEDSDNVSPGEHRSLAADIHSDGLISYFLSISILLPLRPAPQTCLQGQPKQHSETVDSAGHVGEYTSLAFHDDGHLYINYHDTSAADLKYAELVEV